jgi:hypothetical protein
MQTLSAYIHIVWQALAKTISILVYLFIVKVFRMRVDKLRAIFTDLEPEPQVDPLEFEIDDLVKVKSAVVAVQHFMTVANIYSVRYPDTFNDRFPQIQSNSYNKIYTLIEPVNLQSLSEREFTLYEDEIAIVEYSLDSLLMFFEASEEFEKCAKIKATLDIVKTKQILSPSESNTLP